jgi:lipopolysaccharide transport system ATP-binding protein
MRVGVTFDGVFVFLLPLLPIGQHAVMNSVADGTLNEYVQHHWVRDALIINLSFSKVRYGLFAISFGLTLMEIIHE